VDSSGMLFLKAWRSVAAMLALGVVLLAGSVYLVGRDAAFARNEAEAEVVALAEVNALAIGLVPANGLDSYLDELLKHPAIATVTVYSAAGERTTRTRPVVSQRTLIGRLLPALEEPVVGCRALDQQTICLQVDPRYYETRAAAMIVPHVIVLAAAGILLLVAMVLAGGTSRAQLRDLTRVVQAAAEQNDYSRRTTAGKGQVGALSGAINSLLEQMQQRDLILRRRTTELESANKELEAFSYSVSHDLRSPLASVDGFSQALADSATDRLDEAEREYLSWIRDGVEQMKNLVAGLLQMSRITRSELNRSPVDLTAMAGSIAQSLQHRDASRSVEFRIAPDLIADCDEGLVHAVLENLMSNAYKFTGKTARPVIEVGADDEAERRTYFVKDNGAGFDSAQAAKMFTPFQRLHSSTDFEGTGIGLATVKRIIEKHGGAIWADGRIGQGATFYFTLGETHNVGREAEVAGLTRA
jgi:signal transduction histidine kinase